MVLATRALAGELSADVSSSLDEVDFQATLGQPRHLLVIGDARSGRAGLLPLLFGTAATASTTSQILVHHHTELRPACLDEPLLSGIPHDSNPGLLDLALIEAPAAPHLTQAQTAAIPGLAAQASAILAVLSADNPWEPATWKLLGSLSSDSQERLLLILRHPRDTVAADLAVLHRHIADLAGKRLGFLPRIFALPLADPKGPPPDRNEPGCAALRHHLTAALDQDARHLATMARWKALATSALRSIEIHIEQVERQLGEQQRHLARSQEDIDRIQSRFRQDLESGMADLAAALQEESAATANELHAKLGVLPSLTRLFSRDSTASAIEKSFLETLQSAIRHFGREDAQEISAACLAHWTALTADPGDLSRPIASGSHRRPEEILSQAEARFTEFLGKAAADRLSSLHLRGRLDRELRRRNRTLGAYMASTLVLLTLGASAGALGMNPWWPQLLCGTAFLFLTGAATIAGFTRPRILEIFHQLRTEACTTFAHGMQSGYEDALRTMLRDYSEVLIPLHRAVAKQESTIHPLQRRWQEIFLQLKTIP